MGHRPPAQVENARQGPKVPPQKTGGARGRASRSALPAEAGLHPSTRPLAAQRAQRHVDDPARTSNPRSRVLCSRRCSEVNGRPPLPRPHPYWALMAGSFFCALASLLPPKKQQTSPRCLFCPRCPLSPPPPPPPPPPAPPPPSRT